MKALVLAAGVGSRLGEITRRTPKCMLPIAGRPLLDYWMEELARVGATEIYVNTHHLADQVRPYLQAKPHGVSVREGFEPELLGSAGTLRNAQDFLATEERFLIIYADNYAEVDLSRLIEFHDRAQRPPLVLLAYRTPEPQRCGILVLNEDGRVISFEEKPESPKSDIANSGIHVATPELFDFLPAHTPSDIGFHVLPKLLGKMYAFVTNEFIQDVGSPAAYDAVRARREHIN